MVLFEIIILRSSLRQEKNIIKKSFLMEPKHYSFIWINAKLLAEGYEYSYARANRSSIQSFLLPHLTVSANAGN